MGTTIPISTQTAHSISEAYNMNPNTIHIVISISISN